MNLKKRGENKMAEKKCNALALGYGIAILSAIYMLALGILANLGIYAGAAQAMQQWHMFFDLSIFGIITGMIEAAVHGFIAGYLIAFFYNKFV